LAEVFLEYGSPKFNFGFTEFSEVVSGDPTVRSLPEEYETVQSPRRSREAVHQVHKIVTVL
jgi:hypothetical protein